MHTRIEVATQIYLGLMVIYRDAVVLDSPLFAQQAIKMASELLAQESRNDTVGPAAMPATASPLERDQARQIVEDNQDLIAILKAASNASQRPEGSSLH